ncbi:hypothetical protein VPH35_063086 [Triticum aestivum]
MESVAEKILREILLKLPTGDVGRCCCVSRLWRGVVTDPSFRSLHAARDIHVVVPSAGAEANDVSQIGAPGKRLEATVFGAKAMCRVLDLSCAYSPMESVVEETLREILLKLPTRDAARCCCVSRLWRRIVTDPSFHALHARASHVVSGAGAEALIVSETRAPGKSLQMGMFNVSSPKPMCCFLDLASGYHPTNVCNGFVLLTSGVENLPLFVCNPVTGEKLEIPPQAKINYTCWHAMGFSPSTQQYKLFRFSLTTKPGFNYLHVYTLGDGRGWRRHPVMVPYSAIRGLGSPPPMLVDGKIYLVVRPGYRRERDMLLVIDVASEAHSTYCLPCPRSNGEAVAVHVLELRGQLCVAMRTQREIDFWIMPQLGPLLHDKNDKWLLDWVLRYNFYMGDMDDHDTMDRMTSTWLNDGDGMLCYRLDNRLYKYDTTKNIDKKQQYFCTWEHEIQLPATPYKLWNAFGGYRPSLLSPHLAFQSESNLLHRNAQEHFEHPLLHAVPCPKPSAKRHSMCAPNDADNQHAAKRVREPTP